MRLSHVLRFVPLTLLVAGLGCSSGGSSGGGAGPGAFVVPYSLVIACIGLAVFLVVHPSRRRDRAKPEAYDKPK